MKTTTAPLKRGMIFFIATTLTAVATPPPPSKDGPTCNDSGTAGAKEKERDMRGRQGARDVALGMFYYYYFTYNYLHAYSKVEVHYILNVEAWSLKVESESGMGMIVPTRIVIAPKVIARVNAGVSNSQTYWLWRLMRRQTPKIHTATKGPRKPLRRLSRLALTCSFRLRSTCMYASSFFHASLILTNI